MDYEKKYKDALEVAREIYKADFKAIWLENLFPELKESEDEKMRKLTIHHLDRAYQNCAFDEYKNEIEKCIAWLEKQKSENNVSEEVDSQVWQIANNAAITWEQSMAILMAADKAFKKGKAEGLKEQKPIEWSEKDERICNSVIADIESLRRCRCHTLEDYFNELIDWLKSLKQRMEKQQ